MARFNPIFTKITEKRVIVGKPIYQNAYRTRSIRRIPRAKYSTLICSLVPRLFLCIALVRSEYE